MDVHTGFKSIAQVLIVYKVCFFWRTAYNFVSLLLLYFGFFIVGLFNF